VHAQRFRAAHGPLAQHVRRRRHLLPAPIFRGEMRQRFQNWREGTSLAAAASVSFLMPSCATLPSTHVGRQHVDQAKWTASKHARSVQRFSPVGPTDFLAYSVIS
jgi:hypothetical protein